MLPAIKTFSSKYFFHNSDPDEPISVEYEEKNSKLIERFLFLIFSYWSFIALSNFLKKEKKKRKCECLSKLK